MGNVRKLWVRIGDQCPSGTLQSGRQPPESHPAERHTTARVAAPERGDGPETGPMALTPP
jgi:hypothetical protein